VEAAHLPASFCIIRSGEFKPGKAGSSNLSLSMAWGLVLFSNRHVHTSLLQTRPLEVQKRLRHCTEWQRAVCDPPFPSPPHITAVNGKKFGNTHADHQPLQPVKNKNGISIE
jgi:hypothetical protein